MRFNKNCPRKSFCANDLLLYAVTDRNWCKTTSLDAQVATCLTSGVTMVQIREKDLPRQDFLQKALRIRALCQDYNVPFVVNDDVWVAKHCKADGVHIGQGDMSCSEARKILGEDAIIGVSAQTTEQALEAQAQGADYLGVGAVFTTTTKDDADAVSLDELTKICKSVDIPVVAIGGITSDNLDTLTGTGISGIAVVSAIFGAHDIEAATSEIYKKTKEMVGKPMRSHSMKSALTIAGSDSSGGAGIQADIKTMQANGVFATCAISALTAQNTMGVSSIMEVSPEFLAAQIDSVFTDIRPDAVKTGMVSSCALIHTIAERLKFYEAENIVVDPVMVATSGARLISEDAIDTLKSELLPLARVITPNIPEAEVLWGHEITSEDDMVIAAKAIHDALGCAVLLKGGHSINDANDLLVSDTKCRWFEGKRIQNPNTHGTGCTLSSAIASNLAKGMSLEDSVGAAKTYISSALADMLDLGQGSGPMNHGFRIDGDFR